MRIEPTRRRINDARWLRVSYTTATFKGGVGAEQEEFFDDMLLLLTATNVSSARQTALREAYHAARHARWDSVALSLCTTAHALYTRFTNIIIRSLYF